MSEPFQSIHTLYSIVCVFCLQASYNGASGCSQLTQWRPCVGSHVRCDAAVLVGGFKVDVVTILCFFLIFIYYELFYVISPIKLILN